MLKSIFTKTKRNLKAGFTLLEMTMVIGIFGVLTAIVAFNYGSFNNQITLTNLAYEVAMQIRESQVFSLGVRGANGDFNTRYGTYFNSDTDSTFIYFADTYNDGDGICSNSGSGGVCNCVTTGSECLNVISLTRSMKIDSLWVSDGGDPLTDPGRREIDTAHITFKRPNPDAIILDGVHVTQYSGVAIIIRSPDNKYKAVVVLSSGQISVKDYVPD